MNLVRITPPIFQCVPDTGHVEQVNLYSYAGYRQETCDLTARIFLVLPVAMMFPLAFADLR